MLFYPPIEGKRISGSKKAAMMIGIKVKQVPDCPK
jgi:hypothetical protein